MYLFLDTEFTDFKDCDLISLALVSEDCQHEFYVEIIDHKVEWQSDFVKEVIVPLLDNDKYGMKFDDAARALKGWIDQLPRGQKVEIIVDYGMDHQLLLNLLEGAKPSRDFGCYMLEKAFVGALHERGFHILERFQEVWLKVVVGIEDYYVNLDSRRHHALVDAKANRSGWIKGLKHAERT